MSILNTTVKAMLVDDLEYIEYERVDTKKPWLYTKEKTRFKVTNSVITRSGVNTNQSSNTVDASSTTANIVTAMEYDFKIGGVILDHYRKESYSILNIGKNHNQDSLEYFATRLGLEWIDAYK